MFGIYIHIPFCIRKCGYCDFCSYTNISANNQSLYIGKLLKEIEYYSHYNNYELSSIFIGGGTPSVLSYSHLSKIFNSLKEYWKFSNNIEITIEANPDTLTKEKLEQYSNLGINRISIGAQSFDEKVLQTLNRTHSIDNVFDSIKWAKELNLKTSLDLIYGTPGESINSWGNSLSTAINTGVEHLSIYALELHKNTDLSKKFNRLDEDMQAEKYFIADSILNKNGFNWYEISNYAKGDNKSIHNLNYWTGGNWVGFGISAHSAFGNKRWFNDGILYDYIESDYKQKNCMELSEKELATEKIMLSLRTSRGLKAENVDEHIIKELLNDKLICVENNSIIPTLKGRMLLDAIIMKLI